MSEPAKRTEVAHVQSAEIVTVGAAPLMDVISRAAADPNTDVDKLERLLGMYERITAQQAKASYTTALAEMQPKLPVIDERGAIDLGKGGKAQTYAKWEDINDAIRPLLHEHGFALSFRTGVATDGKLQVTGVLAHRDGHQEETTMTLPHDSSGSKNAVQAVGSSTSYGKRYVTIALLNITSRARSDRDDDGRHGDPNFYVGQDQVDDLQALIDEVKAHKPSFLQFMGVKALKDIPARDFQKAKTALEAKRRAPK
jgi:hypothetical protein